MGFKRVKVRRWVKVLLSLIIIFTLVFLYSKYIEIKNIKINEYNIIDSNIPESFYGIKIVQISDIHYKETVDKKYLEKIIKEINLIKPDIVILSGDLLSNNIKYTNEDFEILKSNLNNISYTIGKYAIKGEQDLSFDNWNEIITNSGFIDINDNFKTIYNNGLEPILLIGISSNYKSNHIEETINNIYSNINQDYKYSVLVLHEPDFINYIDFNKFNLILAGHTHGGEIRLPFIGGIINDKYSNYNKEFYDLSGTKLFISYGIGTNKNKARFLNKPSMNLYRLRNK